MNQCFLSNYASVCVVYGSIPEHYLQLPSCHRDWTVRTRSAGNPRQAKSAAGEVSISKDVRQTKVIVIELRVEIEEVGNVNVGWAELVVLSLDAFTGRGVVDAQSLDDELQADDVLEDRRLVDVIHCFDVLRHQRGNLLAHLCVRLFRLVLLYVVPEKGVSLNVQRTGPLGGKVRWRCLRWRSGSTLSEKKNSQFVVIWKRGWKEKKL